MIFGAEQGFGLSHHHPREGAAVEFCVFRPAHQVLVFADGRLDLLRRITQRIVRARAKFGLLDQRSGTLGVAERQGASSFQQHVLARTATSAGRKLTRGRDGLSGFDCGHVSERPQRRSRISSGGRRQPDRIDFRWSSLPRASHWRRKARIRIVFTRRTGRRVDGRRGLGGSLQEWVGPRGLIFLGLQSRQQPATGSASIRGLAFSLQIATDFLGCVTQVEHTVANARGLGLRNQEFRCLQVVFGHGLACTTQQVVDLFAAILDARSRVGLCHAGRTQGKGCGCGNRRRKRDTRGKTQNGREPSRKDFGCRIQHSSPSHVELPTESDLEALGILRSVRRTAREAVAIPPSPSSCSAATHRHQRTACEGRFLDLIPRYSIEGSG